MCNRHSFIQDRAGNIYDGGGLTHSHSEIASLNGVKQDGCNQYEWRPPKKYPDAEVLGGLVKDLETFVPKQSHLERIAAYLVEKFPTREVFDAPETVADKWHGQTVKLSGRELTVICKPTAETLTDGLFWVIGQTVKAWDNATVEAWGNATVEAGDNATVKAGDNATVEALGNATVEAGDNATVIYPVEGWSGQVSTVVKERAVLIDRRGDKLVFTTAADAECRRV